MKSPPDDFSFFDVLGLPANLALNEDELRANFYALSGQLHPDRFATKSPQEAMYSARWSTALNKAYQALRDREKRAHYLLELFHFAPKQKSTAVPLDLAEAYFELQDLLTEPGGKDRLRSFAADLQKQRVELDAQWGQLEEAWAKTPGAAPVLESLHGHLTKQRYLDSMISDVERLI